MAIVWRPVLASEHDRTRFWGKGSALLREAQVLWIDTFVKLISFKVIKYTLRAVYFVTLKLYLHLKIFLEYTEAV